jgi:hypothetical protein
LGRRLTFFWLLLLFLFIPGPICKSAYQKVDAIFARSPSGTTPALEKLQESFLRGQGVSIARYFFGDGLPNGGTQAVDAIIKLLKNRASPESNPLTFISCTNEDEAVEVSVVDLCCFIIHTLCGSNVLSYFARFDYQPTVSHRQICISCCCCKRQTVSG